MPADNGNCPRNLSRVGCKLKKGYFKYELEARNLASPLNTIDGLPISKRLTTVLGFPANASVCTATIDNSCGS